MPKFSQRQRYTLAILCSLLIAGLVLLSFPAPAEQDVAIYSTPIGYSTSALQKVIGYALSGYYASAHITTENTATVTLTLVESYLVIFTRTFPAGTFDIPNTPITAANGGTVFLTITSQNQVITQMNVVAKIFHTVTARPFFWAGVGILGLTGLLTLAIFYQHTTAGKLARRILPVEKAGLGWP
jgi:hypothetical protein